MEGKGMGNTKGGWSGSPHCEGEICIKTGRKRESGPEVSWGKTVAGRRAIWSKGPETGMCFPGKPRGWGGVSSGRLIEDRAAVRPDHIRP